VAREYNLSVLFKVIDRATGPLREVGRNLDKLGGPIDRLKQKFKELAQSAKEIGQRMRAVGQNLSIGLTAPILAASGLALKGSMDFNKAMANVASLIPGNIKRVKDLKKATQKMSVEFHQHTVDMAEGLYEVISAFEDSAETEERMAINAEAATAGQTKLADAVALTSAVTKAYGDISAKALRTTSDLAFQTVTLGRTNFPELAHSIGRTTGLTAALNITQKELFAGFATLTGVTGNTAEVSTQLMGVFRAFVKPSEDMRKAIKKLGYGQKGAAAMFKEKGLLKVFQTLIKMTKGSAETLGKLFPESESLVAMLTLAGPQAETFIRKLNAMNEALGRTHAMFLEQTEGINKTGMAWERFKIKVEVLRQELGDALSPALESVLELLSPIFEWIKNLSPTTQKWIMIIGLLAAVIGPLIIGLGMLVGAITLIGTVTAPVWAAIVAITLALIALGTSIKIWFGGWNPFKDYFDNLFLCLKELWNWVLKITHLPKWLQKKLGFEIGVNPGKESVTVKGGEAPTGAKGVAGAVGATGKSETDINIKLTADEGTSASIEKVKKKKGDASVNVATIGYVGAH